MELPIYFLSNKFIELYTHTTHTHTTRNKAWTLCNCDIKILLIIKIFSVTEEKGGNSKHYKSKTNYTLCIWAKSWGI